MPNDGAQNATFRERLAVVETEVRALRNEVAELRTSIVGHRIENQADMQALKASLNELTAHHQRRIGSETLASRIGYAILTLVAALIAGVVGLLVSSFAPHH